MTEHETKTARPANVVAVPDNAQRGWHVELSFSDDWGGMMQFASVNPDSPVKLPPEVEELGPNGEPKYGPEETLDGWRVTLDKAGLGDLIAKAQEIHAKMSG